MHAQKVYPPKRLPPQKKKRKTMTTKTKQLVWLPFKPTQKTGPEKEETKSHIAGPRVPEGQHAPLHRSGPCLRPAPQRPNEVLPLNRANHLASTRVKNLSFLCRQSMEEFYIYIYILYIWSPPLPHTPPFYFLYKRDLLGVGGGGEHKRKHISTHSPSKWVKCQYSCFHTFTYLDCLV